jgi:hypothetical protein
MSDTDSASSAKPIKLESIFVSIDWFKANVVQGADFVSEYDELVPNGLSRLEVYNGGELLGLYYGRKPKHVRILTKKPTKAMYSEANRMSEEDRRR